MFTISHISVYSIQNLSVTSQITTEISTIKIVLFPLDILMNGQPLVFSTCGVTRRLSLWSLYSLHGRGSNPGLPRVLESCAYIGVLNVHQFHRIVGTQVANKTSQYFRFMHSCIYLCIYLYGGLLCMYRVYDFKLCYVLSSQNFVVISACIWSYMIQN